MRSRDGISAVMTGEGGRWRHQIQSISPLYLSPGCERHETQLELHWALSSISSPPPHRAPRGREREESTFVSRFGSTALSEGCLNPRKTERLRDGEDHVGFVRDESALDRKRDFLGSVERSSGGRSMGGRCLFTKDGWLNPA